VGTHPPLPPHIFLPLHHFGNRATQHNTTQHNTTQHNTWRWTSGLNNIFSVLAAGSPPIVAPTHHYVESSGQVAHVETHPHPHHHHLHTLVPLHCFGSRAKQHKHNTTRGGAPPGPLRSDAFPDTKSHSGGVWGASVDQTPLLLMSHMGGVWCSVRPTSEKEEEGEEEEEEEWACATKLKQGKGAIQAKGLKGRCVQKGWGANIHPDFNYLPSWHKGGRGSAFHLLHTGFYGGWMDGWMDGVSGAH
jgi:hypothetical protein